MKTNMIHVNFTNFDGEFEWHFYLDRSLVGQYAKIGKGGNVVNSPNPYKIRVDYHGSKKHIHIYKNGEFVVINIDGTRRHGDGSPVKLPKKLYDWIGKNLPDFNLPDDRMIYFRDIDLNLDDVSENITFDWYEVAGDRGSSTSDY